MLPQLKKLNNESGIVLLIVLMAVIIILIFSAGILTQSMNEINYAQQQIDQITCDQLKRSYLWNAYAANSMQTVTTANPIQVIVDGRTYNITMATAVLNATENTWQVSCSYDTFQ